MDFYEMLDQVLDLLRRRGRVSYRALKRQLDVDEETFEDLKAAVLFDHPQAKDEDGRGLVWAARAGADRGAVRPAAAPPAAPAEPWALEPNAYTPPHLADKIFTSRAALHGERKQVTVVFCDLANSTGIAERLGAEAMHELLSRFFQLALDAVHRYEGNINQFLGDGFMALFGAPIAHEDHARRAVLAALHLRRRIDAWNRAEAGRRGVRLAIRCGMNTGSVVVGAIGDNLRMDYTAVGDITNVASRLEGHATTGQIVISETTHRLVEGYCKARYLGTLALKGKAAPTPAWEVRAAFKSVTRFDVEVERGLTRFTGRERELHALQERFALARAGHGQVVVLIGDAGIGKSRLLLELRQRLEAADAAAAAGADWLEGRALSFAGSSAFHPLIDLLRRNFGIAAADAAPAAVAKVERALLRHGEPFRPDLPYLRYLLTGDPGDGTVRAMDPQLRRGELFRALRRVLFHAPEGRPRVIVLEDLQWMDQATQDFLAACAGSIPRSRVLVLVTCRPGDEPPFGDDTWQTRLHLQPLSTTHSVRIAQAMLSVDLLPDELAGLLSRKTEGNPFFVEQVVRSLREAGAIREVGNRCVMTRPIADIPLPESVHDVLTARVDRLDEQQKATLQLAAVVGREFTYRLLARLEADRAGRLDARLRELATGELICELSRDSDRTYAFSHALLRDVAYDSLLAGNRRDLHRLIGETIEEFDAPRMVEHAVALAHHFERAQAWDKALTHLVRAGRTAQQASALKEALDFHERALAVCERLGSAVDPETHRSIYARKGEAHFLRSEFLLAVEAHRHALRIARRVGDRAHEADALYRMGFAYHWAHEFEQALRCSERAKALALAIGATSTVAACTFVIGYVHAVLGELDEATRHCEDALRISRQAGDAEHEAFSLFVLGQVRNWNGEYAPALRLLEQALRIGRTGKLPFVVVGVLWMAGIARCGRGDYEEALGSLREALDLSERLDDRAYRGRILNTLGWVCGELHDLHAALAYNRSCLQAAQEIGDPEIVRNAQLNLADTLVLTGDLEEAEGHLEAVHERLQQRGTWGEDWMKWRYAQHLWHSLGELWLRKGDGEMALIYGEACCRGAEQAGSRRNLAKGWRLRGQGLLAQGRPEEAEPALRRALAISVDLGNPPQLWRTWQALALLYEERGEPERAHAAYSDALEVIRRVAARLQDPARRRTFLAAQPVRQIREGAARTR